MQAPRTPARRAAADFANLADFALAVRAAAFSPKAIDPRLMAAATTYGNTTVGSAGGYAVPQEMLDEILAPLDGADSLFRYCRQIEIDSSSLIVPVDEDPNWSAAGVYAAWEGEGATLPERKPKLGSRAITLSRLKALVPATSELDEDAPALSDWLSWRFGEAILYRMNYAIVQGLGVGMPLGILPAPATIEVPKETGQAAATIVSGNALKMWSRLLSSSATRAVWIANPDALQYLGSCTWENGAPAYATGNGTGASGGYLMGRPVLLTEACPALGQKGDLILGDLSNGYLAVKRVGAPRVDRSVHLYFDQDVNAYRLVFRAGGQPLLSAPITPPNSSNTRSQFTVLAARA